MQENRSSLDDALALMRDLRTRCEWDAAQTHESLRPYLLEEAHEVDDAIRAGDDALLRDELGDLLLQVLFHSVVAEDRGAFDVHDVARGFIAKMQRRHPHLYGEGERVPWEQQKARKRASIVDGLPVDLPALHRAFRLQDRAAGIGFDWDDVQGPLAKVAEELEEVREELAELIAECDRWRIAHDKLRERMGQAAVRAAQAARSARPRPRRCRSTSCRPRNSPPTGAARSR